MHETHQFPEHRSVVSHALSFIGELVRFALVAAVIVIPIRMFVAQPFIVSGASMVPTFENGDYLIVDELSYNLGSPERGDVAIFKYPLDQTKYFIKRVIGLPGETLAVVDGTVTVTTTDGDTVELDEPYLRSISNETFTVTLGADEYFVLGDNRTNSSDSRTWGALPRELLVGKAFVRLLPITEIEYQPGKHEFLVTE